MSAALTAVPSTSGQRSAEGEVRKREWSGCDIRVPFWLMWAREGAVADHAMSLGRGLANVDPVSSDAMHTVGWDFMSQRH